MQNTEVGMQNLHVFALSGLFVYYHKEYFINLIH